MAINNAATIDATAVRRDLEAHNKTVLNDSAWLPPTIPEIVEDTASR
jgi:hypothetical protein